MLVGVDTDVLVAEWAVAAVVEAGIQSQQMAILQNPVLAVVGAVQRQPHLVKEVEQRQRPSHLEVQGVEEPFHMVETA